MGIFWHFTFWADNRFEMGITKGSVGNIKAKLSLGEPFWRSLGMFPLLPGHLFSCLNLFHARFTEFS